MNEELQNALVNFVSMITSAAETAGGFAAEQMPEVIEQLLLWTATISAAWFLLGVFLFLNCMLALYEKGGIFSIAIGRARQARANAEAAYEAGERWTRFGHGGSSVTSVRYDGIMVRCAAIEGGTPYALLSVAGLTISASNLEWLKILIAPKVWLIEYAAGLVK